MLQLPTLLWIVLSVAGFQFVKLVYEWRRRSLKFLRGPPSNSFLLGNELEMSHQAEVGDLDFKWFREYGTVFRAAACYGQDTLMVADPKALQHILHTSSYAYPRTKDMQRAAKVLLGRGVLWAEGSTHQRHRKVLNAAFSSSHLRQFLPIFQSSTKRLVREWNTRLTGEGQVMDMAKWLPKVTLDDLGQSAFDFQFGGFEEKSNELASAVKTLFADSRALTNATLLYRAFRRSLPDYVEGLFEGYKTKEDIRFDHYLRTSKRMAKDVLMEKQDLTGDQQPEGKDVLSVLVRSNNAEDPKKRLDDDEVLSQMSTIILAGHDTSANTMIWMLYELSRHPADQDRIRAEIAQARLQTPDRDFTYLQYDAMPFFNACIKEVLRLHPVAITVLRQASRDDVIPLEQPVISTSGETLSEIPIRKGQRIQISVPSYNRLTCVWGEDAHEWNPQRFMTPKKKQTTVGVHANLMTFSGGVRACLGWRYALIEIQSVIAGLLESFEFTMPPGGLDIQRVPFNIMAPMIRGKLHEGIQMPLSVRALGNTA